MRALLALALAPTLTACADDALRDPPDAGGDAAAGCRAPLDAPPWLDDYLATTIARLSGAADVAPGVRLADRATSTRRAATRSFVRDELVAAGLPATFDDYGTGANVTVELPATTGGAAPLILVGAHLDSVAGSPGADDNASGTAAVLAIARMLAAVPCRDRAVRVVLFDQEEVGLVGSTYLAGALRQAGTAVAAVHTLDQIGWDADGDRRFEIEQPTAARLAEYEAAAAALGVAVTATDVWIAGDLMSGGVLRYREAQPIGSRWERLLPGANIQRVLARTPTDVWAFSFDRQAWRWDGTSWTATTIPFDGASISAAVLIGATLYAADSASQTVWRTSGGAWVAHATWPPTTYAEALAGTGPDDLWIGGTDLYHYSGGGAFDPAFVPSQVSRITAMWAVSPDDVWIAGEHDNAFVIGHRSIPGPFGPPAFVALDDGPHLGGALRAMWGVGPADIWAVGDGGGLYHYDGQRWAPIEPATGAVATALTAVGGAGPARVWAVGDAGVILRQRDALPPLAAPPCADAVALYCMENMPPLVGTIPAGGRALYRFDPPYRASISLTLDARAIATPRTLGLRILGRDPGSGRCDLANPQITASTPTANLQVPTPSPTTPPLVVAGHAPVFIELTAAGATTGTGYELYLGCGNPP